MDRYLSSARWRELAEDYRMRLGEPPADSVRTIALSELQDEAVCREYISWLKDYIGAPDMQVAASMLAKRIGYLWIAPILTAMTVHNHEVFFPLDRSFLYHPASTEETTFPFLALDGLQSASPQKDRAVWREAVIEENFAARLAPLLQMLANVGPVSMAVLWENIMVRIAPLYAPRADLSGEERLRMQEDFAFLTRTAPGTLFGSRRNPFTRFTGGMTRLRLRRASALRAVSTTGCPGNIAESVRRLTLRMNLN